MTTATITTALYGRTSESITLPAAISTCQTALKDGVALLYTPARCYLAKFTDEGTCTDGRSQQIGYGAVFEARIFTPDYELRWLNHTGGLGRAVLLCDQQTISPEYLQKEIDPLSVIKAIPQQYLLWGEGIDHSPAEAGWSTLATARIGRLAVPKAGIVQGKCGYLNSLEYLAADDFGNVTVVEERLRSLTVADIPKATASA